MLTDSSTGRRSDFKSGDVIEILQETLLNLRSLAEETELLQRRVGEHLRQLEADRPELVQ